MSQRTIAITGASGKTGFRIAEELIAYGDRPRLLLRSESVIPETLSNAEQVRISLQDSSALDAALKGCLLYTSPSPRDGLLSRMPSSA